MLGSGNTTLVISNDEIEDIIKIVESHEDSGSLLEGVTETVQNEVKEQKERFFIMLLGTLGASLLGNLLTGRRVNRAGKGRGINRVGEGAIATRQGQNVRAGYGNSKMDF